MPIQIRKLPPPNIMALIFAAIMFSFTILGVWLRFSPIPFGDMWNGTLGFVLDVRDAQHQQWWGQHNEHRIILSRALFIIDYTFFGGMNIFLTVLNIVFASFVALIFFIFAKRLSEKSDVGAQTYLVAALLIAGFSFSWVQKENFTWGFQSQFFLAQLLPLVALYFIARSSETHRNMYFLLALSFGVLSAGSMANGIAILPIIFIYLLIIWPGYIKAVASLTLAVLVPTLYFYDYTSVSYHGSILHAIKNSPIELLRYTFTYIGSPFYRVTGSRDVAAISGLMLAIFSIIVAYKQIRSNERSPYIIALLCFLIYIGASAFGTAGGRLVFGLSSATSSRYATPAVMAWGAFALTMIASFPPLSRRMVKTVWSGVTIVCILGLAYQFKALAREDDRLFEWELASLALELGVRDDQVIHSLFPSVDYALTVAARAKAQGLSVFGTYPLKSIAQAKEENIAVNSAPACMGTLDTFSKIAGSENHIRVSGWIFEPASRKVPKIVTFTDEHGSIIGFGLSGQPLREARGINDRKAHDAGYGGYIRAVEAGSRIFAYGDDPVCRLEVLVPG